MVGRVAREMDRRGLEITDVKYLAIIHEMVKNDFVLLLWDPVSFAEKSLHLTNALANGNRWIVSLLLCKTVL
ncbi:hypothetical protein Trco_008497 [Trichoderma cornu-damae]|uniref:Uncharacterized protein n=1 Tax=Trichoderma cornu-damae TaxID=654480 RepID=A0A9P8QJI6_9HYPO|nr:hypothetical protein Trco_008497 [Trichoderma cornu-damae]